MTADQWKMLTGLKLKWKFIKLLKYSPEEALCDQQTGRPNVRLIRLDMFHHILRGNKIFHFKMLIKWDLQQEQD